MKVAAGPLTLCTVIGRVMATRLGRAPATVFPPSRYTPSLTNNVLVPPTAAASASWIVVAADAQERYGLTGLVLPRATYCTGWSTTCTVTALLRPPGELSLNAGATP